MKNRFTKTFSKEKATAIVALLSFTAYLPLSTMSAFAADMVGVNTLPTIDSSNIVNGGVSTSGNTMNVQVFNQTGGSNNGVVGQFDWNTFNVGRNATVNWDFTGNNQTALNRVLSTGGMSYIYGKLTNSGVGVDTSKVILINPNGILFGNGSSVNLNSFTASTKDILGARDLSQIIEDATALNNYIGINGNNGVLNDIAGYNKTIQFDATSGILGGSSSNPTLASITGEGVSITVNKDLDVVANGNIEFSSDPVIGAPSSHITSNNGNITLTGKDVKITGKTESKGAATYTKATTVSANGTDGGNITINSNKLTVDKANINADNEINVNATGKININTNSTLAANKSIDLTSTNEINIDSSSLTSEAGDINIESVDKAGDVLISNTSSVTANDGNINLTGNQVMTNSAGTTHGTITFAASSDDNTKGNLTIDSDYTYLDMTNVTANKVDITSDTRNVTMWDGNDIEANYIKVTSGHDILLDNSTLHSQTGIDLNADYGIYHDGDGLVLIAENGDINSISGIDQLVYGTDITANNGNINIEAGGTINIGTEANAYSSFTAKSNDGTKGDVNISGNYISFYKSTIDADKDANLKTKVTDYSANPVGINITGGEINAGNKVSVDAAKSLSIKDGSKIVPGTGTSPENPAVYVPKVSSISAGTGVDLTAGKDITITNSTVTSEAGDINIESVDKAGDVMLSNASSVTANDGNINIEGKVIGINNSYSEIPEVIEITAKGEGAKGNVTISSNANSWIKYADIEANKLDINSATYPNDIGGQLPGDIYLYNSSVDANSVDITSEGKFTTDHTEVNAKDGIDITADAIYLYGNVDMASESGDINFTSVKDQNITANITANDGNITMKSKSDYGNIIIHNGSAIKAAKTDDNTKGNITLDGGQINISGSTGEYSFTTNVEADNNVTMKSDTGVYIRSQGIVNAGNKIDIDAVKDIYVQDNSSLSAGTGIDAQAGKDINISTSTLTSETNDINLISTDKAGNVNFNNNATVTANNGNINMVGNHVDMHSVNETGTTPLYKFKAKGTDSANGNFTIDSNSSYISRTDIDADNKVAINSETGDVDIWINSSIDADTIDITAKGSLVTDDDAMLTAKNGANFTVGHLDFDDSTLIVENNDINVKSDTDVDMRGSQMTANNGNVNLNFDMHAFLSNANVTAKSNDDANGNVKLSGRNMNITSSTIKADNNADLLTTEINNNDVGFIYVQNLNVVEAGNKIDIDSAKNVLVNNSTLNSENGTDVTAAKDVNINSSKITSEAGDINIKSTDRAGNITITDSSAASSIVSKDGNINLEANKVTFKGEKAPYGTADYTTSNSIVALGSGENGNVTISQKEDIDLNNDYSNVQVRGANKLTMESDGNITSDGFTSNWHGSNVFHQYPTGGKEVNNALFDSEETTFRAKEDVSIKNTQILQNIVLDGKNVNVERSDEVIPINNAGTNLYLHNLKVKSDSEVGKTTITNNYGGVISTGVTILPDSGKTTIEGENIKTLNETNINANNNKLVLNATGDIDVNLTNVNNQAKGLEVNSNVNTGVTNNYSQDDLVGRNVRINANNETLALSKVKADTLDITAGKIVKGETTISNNTDNLGVVNNNGNLEQVMSANDVQNTGYVEVKTDGGLTINGTKEEVPYEPNSGNVNYNTNYNSNTVEPVVVSSTTENVGEPYKEYVYDANGVAIGYYTHQNTRTTTVLRTRDQHHTATMTNGENKGFSLVYGKTGDKTVVTNGRTSVYCDIEPDIPIRPLNLDNTNNMGVIKNPRLPEGTSNIANINNGITNPSGAAINAAARLNLDEDGNSIEENNTDNEGDFYLGE